MRIALTTPTSWPRVRRGAERFFSELARYLASRGHEVTLISSKPGRSERIHMDGYTAISHRRLWHPSLARLGFLEFHAFFFTALYSLARSRFDIVHCCTFMDTFAAILLRPLNRTPCIFWINSIPPPIQYFRSLSTGGRIIGRVVRQADDIVPLSGYVQEYMRARFGRAGTELPVPVDISKFTLSRDRDKDRPVIFCAASLDDARKGGRLLFQSFNRLKASRPEVVLELGAPVGDTARAELIELLDPRWREDARFLDPVTVNLSARFGAASVSVLPSVWEAFGMVVLESMATGTPVVGTRDGALPELICNDKVGRLFDPGEIVDAAPSNLAGLTRALLEGIDLGQRPETADHCRANAERFSWEQIGPRFEQLYEQIIAKRRSVDV